MNSSTSNSFNFSERRNQSWFLSILVFMWGNVLEKSFVCPCPRPLFAPRSHLYAFLLDFFLSPFNFACISFFIFCSTFVVSLPFSLLCPFSHPEARLGNRLTWLSSITMTDFTEKLVSITKLQDLAYKPIRSFNWLNARLCSSSVPLLGGKRRKLRQINIS